MIDPRIKKLLGFKAKDPDDEVLAKWKKASNRVCKPCWELKYCPYGPFVEQSPLLPLTREEAEQEMIYVEPNEFPEEIPKEIAEMSCTVFGHICPVVFVAEGFTETSECRRRGRYIPFKIKMRVVRRDNYTCQHCGKHLLDNEVEFDHIIPISKGGSSEESNIRLTCFDCNRDKSDIVEI
jgi:hypothetical protein